MFFFITDYYAARLLLIDCF